MEKQAGETVEDSKLCLADKFGLAACLIICLLWTALNVSWISSSASSIDELVGGWPFKWIAGEGYRLLAFLQGSLYQVPAGVLGVLGYQYYRIKSQKIVYKSGKSPRFISFLFLSLSSLNWLFVPLILFLLSGTILFVAGRFLVPLVSNFEFANPVQCWGLLGAVNTMWVAKGYAIKNEIEFREVHGGKW